MYGYHFLAPFPGTTVREKIQDYDLEILTDNWSLYDANDAIVKTSTLLPQDMRDFGARMMKKWRRVGVKSCKVIAKAQILPRIICTWKAIGLYYVLTVRAAWWT